MPRATEDFCISHVASDTRSSHATLSIPFIFWGFRYMHFLCARFIPICISGQRYHYHRVSLRASAEHRSIRPPSEDLSEREPVTAHSVLAPNLF